MNSTKPRNFCISRGLRVEVLQGGQVTTRSATFVRVKPREDKVRQLYIRREILQGLINCTEGIQSYLAAGVEGKCRLDKDYYCVVSRFGQDFWVGVHQLDTFFQIVSGQGMNFSKHEWQELVEQLPNIVEYMGQHMFTWCYVKPDLTPIRFSETPHFTEVEARAEALTNKPGVPGAVLKIDATPIAQVQSSPRPSTSGDKFNWPDSDDSLPSVSDSEVINAAQMVESVCEGVSDSQLLSAVRNLEANTDSDYVSDSQLAAAVERAEEAGGNKRCVTTPARRVKKAKKTDP